MTHQENCLKAKRLERAWSQEQLAEISGLSTRTIQRIEQGGTASLETLKALACAFNIEVSLLQNDVVKGIPTADVIKSAPAEQNNMTSTKKTVRKMEKFQRHLIIYLLVNLGLFIINISTNSDQLWFYYPLIFWGIPLALKGAQAYGLLWGDRRETVSSD